MPRRAGNERLQRAHRACLLLASSGSNFSGPPLPISVRYNPISVPCRRAVRFPSRFRAPGDPGVQFRCCRKAPLSHQQAFIVRKTWCGITSPGLEVAMEQRRDGGAACRPLRSQGRGEPWTLAPWRLALVSCETHDASHSAGEEKVLFAFHPFNILCLTGMCLS